MNLGAKKCGDFRLRHIAGSRREDQFLNSAFRHGELDAVKVEKYQGRRRSGALIAIQKEVVWHEVKSVSGGHFKQVAREIFAPDTGAGLHQGRFQQAEISDLVLAAVTFNLVGVDFQDVFPERKSMSMAYSASFLRSSP